MTWIYLIPIVAILVGGFTEWLKFKEKQLKLGSTTDSLAGNMDDIIERLDSASAENQLLKDRVKNLEAIVTTQMWDDSVASKGIEAAPAPLIHKIWRYLVCFARRGISMTLGFFEEVS